MEPQPQPSAHSPSVSGLGSDYYITRCALPGEHAELCKLAKTSPYTRDFSNRVMFSSDAAYAKGWIRVMLHKREPIGFYCVRQKSRGEKATALYFITVHPDWRSKNVGKMLLDDIKRASPSGIVQLNVAKDNERARAFYVREGFTTTGESLGGTGWSMEWRRE